MSADKRKTPYEEQQDRFNEHLKRLDEELSGLYDRRSKPVYELEYVSVKQVETIGEVERYLRSEREKERIEEEERRMEEEHKKRMQKCIFNSDNPCDMNGY